MGLANEGSFRMFLKRSNGWRFRLNPSDTYKMQQNQDKVVVMGNWRESVQMSNPGTACPTKPNLK
jgi:hypothetical protein